MTIPFKAELDKALELALLFFSADEDKEAGNVINTTFELNSINGQMLYNLLVKEYGPGRVQRAVKLAKA